MLREYYMQVELLQSREYNIFNLSSIKGVKKNQN